MPSDAPVAAVLGRSKTACSLCLILRKCRHASRECLTKQPVLLANDQGSSGSSGLQDRMREQGHAPMPVSPMPTIWPVPSIPAHQKGWVSLSPDGPGAWLTALMPAAALHWLMPVAKKL